MLTNASIIGFETHIWASAMDVVVTMPCLKAIFLPCYNDSYVGNCSGRILDRMGSGKERNGNLPNHPNMLVFDRRIMNDWKVLNHCLENHCFCCSKMCGLSQHMLATTATLSTGICSRQLTNQPNEAVNQTNWNQPTNQTNPTNPTNSNLTNQT